MSIFNFICADCVGEQHLSDLIQKTAHRNAICEYCDIEKIVTTLELVVEQVGSVVENFYEVTSITEAVVIYERTPEGEPLVSIVEYLLNSGNSHPAPRLVEDVVDALSDYWFDYSSQDSKYGEDPWFVRVLPSAGQLANTWSRMLDKLRHEARYINPEVTQTLEEVFGPLEADRTKFGASVIVTAGPAHPLCSFYRARVFNSKADVAAALRHPEKELGPPPRGSSAPGRMNAKGVSVFYGATDPAVTISEVRPAVGSQVLVGKFNLNRDLRLLDLTKFKDVVAPEELSPFDGKALKKFQRISFLTYLGDELTQPVMPDGIEQGYMLTQVVSDYLATHPQLNIDGILFRSTQLSSDAMHLNVILFVKASTVALSSSDHGKKMDGHWFYDYRYQYDQEEPSDGPGPRIEIQESVYPLNSKSSTRKDPLFTLELDRDSLKILEVRQASYITESRDVESVVTVQPSSIATSKHLHNSIPIYPPQD